jgi:hypothetical protein
LELGTVIVDYSSHELVAGSGKGVDGLLGFDGAQPAAEDPLEI